MTMTRGLRVDYLFLLNLQMIFRGVNNVATLHVHQLSLGNVPL